MHELGLIFQVIKRVAPLAAENQVDRILKVTLQIGEVSYVVPEYIEELFPDACEGTPLEGCVLEIEPIKARGKCRKCNRAFDILQFSGECPRCKEVDYDLISGDEFLVKEVLIPEPEL